MTEAPQPGSVEVAAGETFELPFESTPTSGYMWEFAADDPGKSVELLDSKVVPKAAPGANATQVFRFRAVAPGQSTLRFRYARPWASQPAREHTVDVKVRSQ